VPFEEYDVAADQEAAYRMIRLSGQRGVPVITIDDDVVVGFNRRRLKELLAKKPTGKPRLGAAVADAAPRLQVEGAYVGRVRPDSPAAQAGLKAGDVIVELAGQPIQNATDLERVTESLGTGERVTLVYVRRGRRIQGELLM
jgi:S1-C subfamily serine protease